MSHSFHNQDRELCWSSLLCFNEILCIVTLKMLQWIGVHRKALVKGLIFIEMSYLIYGIIFISMLY